MEHFYRRLDMSNKIHLLSFATSNWKNSRNRLKQQIDILNKKHDIFSTVSLLDENDLGDDYYKYFRNYLTDCGFAFWTWKPYLILQKLNEINDNDILFYIDGGDSLPDSEFFVSTFNRITKKLSKYELPIAIGQFNNICPIIVQAKKEILEKYNLTNNNDFLFNYPHYETGALIFVKCSITVNFVKMWYDFMRCNYDQNT